MEKELEKWLKQVLSVFPIITEDKMNSLLNRDISSGLYMQIPNNGNIDIHLGKVEYMMNMIDELNPPKEKPNLNLVIADSSSSLEYVEYLSTDYKVNVINFKDVKNRKDVDLVLFTGGEDVDPELYGETKGQFTYVNKARDKKEREVFNFFRGHVPMLGVCRGNQLLCVLNGGKLIQHVEGHGRDHTIVVKGYQSPITITSTHHQMIYPFNLKEENYELIAYSEFFKSNTYLNGNNEEINLSKEFLEPEIVFYSKSKCLGIQGHPEYGSCNPNTKKVCMKLIKKYLLNKDSKKEELKSWNSGEYYPEDEYYPAPEETIQYKPYTAKGKKNTFYTDPFNNFGDYGLGINIKTVDKIVDSELVSEYGKAIENIKERLQDRSEIYKSKNSDKKPTSSLDNEFPY